MISKFFKLALLSGGAALVLTGNAFATNGYLPNGYGTAAKAMGGAGSAMSLDTQAAVNNPAGMYALGNRVDIGVSLFNPNRDYDAQDSGFINSATGVGKHKSSKRLFLIPSMGVNFDRGDYTLGFTLTANGGMNTTYKNTVFAGSSGKTGVDLAQVLLGMTYARKLDSRNTFGITPTLAAQRFKAYGLQGFAGISEDSTKLTNNGYDYSYGYGVRIGWQGEMTDRLTLGASYQSEMIMTKLSKYAGLFADHGKFNIPPVINLGAAFKATPSVTIAADFQHIRYGDIPAITNSHNYAAVSGAKSQLGGSNDMGFGWQNVNVLKLGAQWKYNDQLTLRAGASHSDKPFKTSETLFNILSPATVNTHLTFGGAYALDARNTINVSYVHAFSAHISGGSNANLGGKVVDLRMDQNDFEVSWDYKF
ncbi:OmpP1/FadL family transporter [Varunaivibrio sulfuroxidans]|nr:outer membrane protein transport protein [Varunaivibrio sulfuroxidans]WES29715.1 outer membrane protein transport protein [Varunaivibrio sulfuroxidans]